MSACGVYARKSTDDSDRNEEARSTTRQVEHAVAYATSKGWTVDPAHVFADDNVSGAIPMHLRPAGARLLKALEPRPPFQALIVSELSRIGRDGIRTPFTVQQIEESGVTIHGYLSGQRISVDDETGEMQTMVHSLAASFERRRAKQRTHDALRRRAEAGRVANGVCFGYRNERGSDGLVRRVVIEAEAAVIRRIFALSAAGSGYYRIARLLNDEGALAPSPRRRGHPRRSWSSTTVRDVLNREAYRGRLVWNQRERVLRGGRRVMRMRPASDWIVRDVPELRIVDDATWQAAHARLADSRRLYLETTGGVTHGGRPANPLDSPYLLTGMLSCGACGGSLFAHRHGHQNREFFSYLCTQYHTRGRAVCKNGLEASMRDADEAVLDAVEHDVLNVAVLETSLAKALDSLRREPKVQDARTRTLRDELARLDAEAARLAAAIATGGELTPLVAALQDREQRRADLAAELTALVRQRAPNVDTGEILRQLRDLLAEWRATLRQEVPDARPALRALLAGRLVFMPRERDGVRFYAFEGPGTVSKIISGLVLPKALAARP